MYDRLAEDDYELTIEKGDIIENVSMKDCGWWQGEINGQRGLFPENYVELIEHKESGKMETADYFKRGKYHQELLRDACEQYSSLVRNMNLGSLIGSASYFPV